jgi:hypothetical protein
METGLPTTLSTLRDSVIDRVYPNAIFLGVFP